MYRSTPCLILLLGAGLLLSGPALAEKVFYRWADESGKVHYGHTLPPEYANKPYEILNDQGIVIERVTDPLARQKGPPKKVEEKELDPLFTEDEVRLRSDRLLVLRYHSEEDIKDAMQVEVDQLGYDRRLINQTQASVMSSLAGQVRNAADRQRAGMPVEAETETEINKLRQRIRRSEQALAQLEGREEEIRAMFQKELERYRFLANDGAPGQMPETETTPDPET